MTSDGNITINNSTKTITAINKYYTGALVINESYNGVIIETIGHEACYKGRISSIDLSGTYIKTIGERAFLQCSNLKTIKLPNTVTSILHNAFGLTKISSFNVPKNVKDFHGGSLNQCPNLNILTVDQNNPYFVSYKNFIFNKDFTSLVRSPNNFQYRDIPLINRIKIIGYMAFSGSNLKSFTASPNVSTIEGSAFHKLPYLKYIDLSLSSETILYFDTFRETYNVEVLILPRNLETLKNGALEKMAKLKELIIPETMELIETGAISVLQNLREIYVLGKFHEGFNDTEIFGGFSLTSPNVRVHASEGYENEEFAGFTVIRDVFQVLNERMIRRLVCTRQRTRSNQLRGKLIAYIFINCK